MQVVSEREKGVVSSLFMAIAGVMVSRFAVMACGVLVVCRRFPLMVYGLLGYRLGGF